MTRAARPAVDWMNAANARVRELTRDMYPDVEVTQRDLCIVASCCIAGTHSRIRRLHGEKVRQYNPWVFGVDYLGTWRETWPQWLRRMTREGIHP
ncbi:hypothetical protein SEA_GENGAR_83 [Mycobacterium phage Gengar]|uniref:Uncharacterized protein n=1 Tax=Mycobacterium phage Gengar TaxID=1891963 RepID=A0A1C9EGX1_9CAUD|nr:hypothetical protein SEA_GENGAR_83 [Mycobacterium phage Gengar]AON96738.1 hypothetical protein SEA_GENGAR_83 [Mycobacterium phage Gengar]